MRLPCLTRILVLVGLLIALPSQAFAQLPMSKAPEAAAGPADPLEQARARP